MATGSETPWPHDVTALLVHACYNLACARACEQFTGCCPPDYSLHMLRRCTLAC